MANAHDYATAAPEIFLAVSAMVLLMLGVFRGDQSTKLLSWLAVAAFAATLLMVLRAPAESSVSFAGMYVADGFTAFVKILVLIAAAGGLILSLGYIKEEGMSRFEYPVLFVLATLGMLMMISANDLIALYMGIELQSLALYVVAAFKRDSLRSTEAGLKYFVLGALSSGMLLYGCSLIYGFTGATGFDAIAAAIKEQEHASIGLIVGIVFLCAGLAFKVSAVPFHMWTPDVYEGAPTPVTAFFAVAPKIAAMALFMRALIVPFVAISADWQQIIIVISVASMLLGAFAAIWQNNIKRLMAYSSIGHVGYALIGLAAGSAEGVRAVLIYLSIYVAMNLGTFACILCMRRKTGMVEGITDLAGLSKSNPLMALALAVFMFSMAGIPPLGGFFGKFYVFVAAMNAELYTLAVIGVLASVVGAFYYLRIIKIMYFDEPAESFEAPMAMEMRAIIGLCGIFVVFFAFYTAPFVASAQIAASALVP
ncbi:MAG: NADH-quinone oxidoreductase subunit NuoN [Alphaproteobacteria bacterium]|jgi:NADH-quinone oxidoreductase subunit N|nr:NADH-quinone oxidoreductase subunit NuoN [Rhodospirillaceae bacterium]MDP6020526.1 NADH-quinone oxidoreductase subunit NuoN [Alphaproteobacteria bacterium]MDP6257191.1 NADH-quinone oxidoreductase subunit NuoN [Alphaproteobacteria bacterium]MDP7052653.1 NADH-quinone oxidoreductase subunit NuoN [Alphaproteobacteria bacterium]MDP7229770.1 NADH-quinone oxidoreductase subunit NuoN [Alphaproteobacteria bacterium]|tara:strand:- start:3269 stop:4711 length:1443 start_codon:yes stop_codon:yes gene_type:complete